MKNIKSILISIFLVASIFTINAQVQTDTLNYPFPGTYVYYGGSYGYVSGNNIFGDLAKANYFETTQNYTITGVLFAFIYATGGNPNIEIDVWNNAGENGSPGQIIGSETVPLNTIKNDITSSLYTYVAFSPAISVTGSFYLGVTLPTTVGDTLVVCSNQDGETVPGTAWELFCGSVNIDPAWYNFNDPNSWQMDVALAVFPIVQYTLSVDDYSKNNEINVYPNPSDGLYYIDTDLFNTKEDIIISIIRSDGKVMSTSKHIGENILAVDFKYESDGIYFMELQIGKNVYIKKLIKQ